MKEMQEVAYVERNADLIPPGYPDSRVVMSGLDAIAPPPSERPSANKLNEHHLFGFGKFHSRILHLLKSGRGR